MLRKTGPLTFRIVDGAVVPVDTGLEEQHAFALRVRDDITTLATIVNQLRSIRTQLKERARPAQG